MEMLKMMRNIGSIKPLLMRFYLPDETNIVLVSQSGKEIKMLSGKFPKTNIVA
jgi:hypothetical protein